MPRWSLIASSVIAGALVAQMPAFAPVVSADTLVRFVGLGNGHGRGMGQWGAYGYAQQGWNAERMVAHYYPDATLGKTDQSTVTVRITHRDGRTLDVFSDAGMLVDGKAVEPGQAVHMSVNGDYTVTTGCGGNVVRSDHAATPKVDPVNVGSNRPENEHLTFCGGDAYRGSLGLANDGGARTVNTVNVDDYLRGVIPSEMIPSWADKGGAEALRAQAITARSYALSERRTDYAQTCDTQSCQVYAGSGIEDDRTDRAVLSSSGAVLMKDGKILRAEYSASTGGLTATNVIDDGDSIAPGHWEETASAGELGQKFGVGELQSIEVIEKGGDRRVTRAKIIGTERTVEVSGEDLRSKAGLSTSAFQVIPVGAAPAPLPIPLPAPGPDVDIPEVLPNIPLPVPVETVEEVTELVGSLSGPMLSEVLTNLQKLLAPPVQ